MEYTDAVRILSRRMNAARRRAFAKEAQALREESFFCRKMLLEDASSIKEIALNIEKAIFKLMNSKRVVKAGIFTSRSNAWISNLIAFASAPPRWFFQTKRIPSHTGVVFKMSDGTIEYWEALMTDSWHGPKAYGRIQEWLKGSTKRWVDIQWFFDLTEDECNMIRTKCYSKLKEWHYGRKQLLKKYFFLRFNKSFTPSDKAIDCAEAAGRIFHPYYDFRVWKDFNVLKHFDQLTPWWVQEVPKVKRKSYKDIVHANS